MDFDLLPESQQPPSMDVVKPRKLYHRPRLEMLGDLRTMTLGTSPTQYQDTGGAGDYEYSSHKLIPDFPLPDEFKQPGDPYIPPL